MSDPQVAFLADSTGWGARKGRGPRFVVQNHPRQWELLLAACSPGQPANASHQSDWATCPPGCLRSGRWLRACSPPDKPATCWALQVECVFGAAGRGHRGREAWECPRKPLSHGHRGGEPPPGPSAGPALPCKMGREARESRFRAFRFVLTQEATQGRTRSGSRVSP